MKFCGCGGKISLCDHKLHGCHIRFGHAKTLDGVVVARWNDAAWQCSGCGMPLTWARKHTDEKGKSSAEKENT